MNNRVFVYYVIDNSIAYEVGIESGDEILSINGEKVKDIFDYRFLITNSELIMEIAKANGEIWEVKIEKDEYEDLGIEFEYDLIDQEKSCHNKCIFCFIDQLPKNMRKTLYFKDDDARLSFLTGNYITMTNQSFDDLERIVRYKMSPINISVHTTNPELRCFMLNNKAAGDVLNKIKYLVENKIIVNCQVVLCPNINDGDELEKTLNDLTSLYPGLNSISIVPVGLSAHREGLYTLSPCDEKFSKDLIKKIGDYQDKMFNINHSKIVFLADEFYLKAGVDLPDYHHYEDFPQIENGVGMVKQFEYDFLERLSDVEADNSKEILLSIATGELVYNKIKVLIKQFEDKIKNIKINVFKIKNTYFGERITVTGLITGSDLVNQLKDKNLGKYLFLCENMFKSGEDIFLDDYKLINVQKELKVNVIKVSNNGSILVDNLYRIIKDNGVV